MVKSETLRLQKFKAAVCYYVPCDVPLRIRIVATLQVHSLLVEHPGLSLLEVDHLHDGIHGKYSGEPSVFH